MSRIWVKICGLRTQEAIEAAVAAGADAVGFVFHEGSPRNLSIDDARSLQAAVPQEVERVAVFLRPTQSLVDAVVEAIEPNVVQTDAEALAVLRLPPGQAALPVVRCGNAVPDPLPPRLLLEGARSGAGEKADWSQAASLARRTSVVLAGGLDAHNVAMAVRQVRPFGVDVSSGVESSRGVKDASMIHEFIRAARAAGQALAAGELVG